MFPNIHCTAWGRWSLTLSWWLSHLPWYIIIELIYIVLYSTIKIQLKAPYKKKLNTDIMLIIIIIIEAGLKANRFSAWPVSVAHWCPTFSCTGHDIKSGTFTGRMWPAGHRLSTCGVAIHADRVNAISTDAVCSFAIAWNLWYMNKVLLGKVAETTSAWKLTLQPLVQWPNFIRQIYSHICDILGGLGVRQGWRVLFQEPNISSVCDL